MKRRDRSLLAIFGAPLLLAALSLIGLVGALLQDGGWDLLGAGLLATTLGAAAVARLAARRAHPGRPPAK